MKQKELAETFIKDDSKLKKKPLVSMVHAQYFSVVGLSFDFCFLCPAVPDICQFPVQFQTK